MRRAGKWFLITVGIAVAGGVAYVMLKETNEVDKKHK